jgi:hypothetical protein
MISFESGKAIAVICGGQYNDQKLYVKNDDNNEKPDRNILNEDVYDILDEDDFNMNKYKKLPVKERNKLERALKQQQEPLDEYLLGKYHKVNNKLNEKLKKEFDLSTGVMVPLPSDESERIYIAAMTGAGKSCLAAMYGYEFKNKFPKKQIYLFSKHEKEKAYKNVLHKEILCDDEMLLEPIDIKLFSNSLLIFDDCDNIQDKEVSKNMTKFINDIITAGRKYGIYCVILGHQLMNYKETRNILNECNRIVFFKTGSVYHITRYLKVYCGLDPFTIKKIIALKSRWSMISQSVPSYVLHEHGLFIV